MPLLLCLSGSSADAICCARISYSARRSAQACRQHGRQHKAKGKCQRLSCAAISALQARSCPAPKGSSVCPAAEGRENEGGGLCLRRLIPAVVQENIHFIPGDPVRVCAVRSGSCYCRWSRRGSCSGLRMTQLDPSQNKKRGKKKEKNQ